MYLRFAVDYPQADRSDTAAMAMFLHESQGKLLPEDTLNAFALGKKWMDVTVAGWKEEIATGGLFVFELLDEYPEWFLARVGVLHLRADVKSCGWWTTDAQKKESIRACLGW